MTFLFEHTGTTGINRTHNHKKSPIHMEDYFSPGYKTKPAVHVGSQSMRLYHGDKLEQAIEGLHMAAASEGDVIVVRNIDQEYIDYWRKLMGNVQIINLKTDNKKEFLSNILLDNPNILEKIKESMHSDSQLMVYFPTELEEKVAEKLGISLHGSPIVSATYGTKTGIRTLAEKAHIPMPEGYVCADKSSVKASIAKLLKKYDSIIIKHTLSSAGRWMKKLSKKDTLDIDTLINEICGGEFIEGRDTFVVEAWIDNIASLCVHIEIPRNQPPVIAAGWQKIIDTDGITYIGAGPLTLTPTTMKKFVKEATKLAYALKEKGAVGSYGPDFIITSENQDYYPPNTPLLLELNARTPVTPFGLEIIKQIKGEIGTGFLTRTLKLRRKITFHEVKEKLMKEGLLITSKDRNAKGVVPYNVGLLEFKSLYYVIMAESWDETALIANRVKSLFLAK